MLNVFILALLILNLLSLASDWNGLSSADPFPIGIPPTRRITGPLG